MPDEMLRGGLSGLNENLPIDRRTLDDYRSNGALSYETRSGHTCEFGMEELDILLSISSIEEAMGVRLPIFLDTDVSGDVGRWKVIGALESKLVSRLIGRNPGVGPTLNIYYPDFVEIRRKLPNLSVVRFMA